MELLRHLRGWGLVIHVIWCSIYLNTKNTPFWVFVVTWWCIVATLTFVSIVFYNLASWTNIQSRNMYFRDYFTEWIILESIRMIKFINISTVFWSWFPGSTSRISSSLWWNQHIEPLCNGMVRSSHIIAVRCKASPNISNVLVAVNSTVM